MKKKLILSLLLSGTFVASQINAQIITTIAGTGTAGFSGDAGAATAANINEPRSVAVDAGGNVYIADFANNRVRKITPGGIINTIAGTGSAGYSGNGGPATAAKLNGPTVVAVDATSSIVISDLRNGRVRKINSSGIIDTIPGYYAATGITFAASGDIYTSEDWSVYKWNSSGGVISWLFQNTSTYGYDGDGGAATAAGACYPANITMDLAGNLYVSDRGNNLVRKVNAAGIVSTIAGDTTGLLLYHSWYFNAGFSGDGGAGTNAKLYNNEGIAVDAAGNVYIADTWNNRIRKVTPGGIITTFAGNGTAGFGGDGGPATAAQLNGPSSVAVDVHGNVYVADSGNHRIRRIGNAGLGTKDLSSTPVILKTYPNPTTGSFSVELQQLYGAATITVIDISGKVLETRNITAPGTLKETFNMKGIAPGTYYVKLEAAGNVYKETIILQ